MSHECSRSLLVVHCMEFELRVVTACDSFMDTLVVVRGSCANVDSSKSSLKTAVALVAREKLDPSNSRFCCLLLLALSKSCQCLERSSRIVCAKLSRLA